jgi:hypothetical protein
VFTLDIGPAQSQPFLTCFPQTSSPHIAAVEVGSLDDTANATDYAWLAVAS